MNDEKTTVLPNERQYDDDSIIRPSGPSGATIGLGIVIAIFGAMVLLFSINDVLNAMWKTFFGDSGLGGAVLVGGFGVILIVAAVVWSLVKFMRDRKNDDYTGMDDSDDSTGSTEKTEEIRTADINDFEK